MRIVIFLIFFINILIGSVDLKQQIVDIYKIDKNNLYINKGNLKIGQSGVVIHNYKNNTIILGKAIIIKSDEKFSIAKIDYKPIYNQDSIPTIKKLVSIEDKFILNHLYKTDIMIVPNFRTKKRLLELYPNQLFLNEDFLASYLKVENTPVPKKDDIINFCNKQQVGLIFLVVKNKLYIIDTQSFKVVDTKSLNIKDKSIKVPFFSNIEKIERGTFDFGAEKIEDYNKYYLNMIGK